MFERWKNLNFRLLPIDPLDLDILGKLVNDSAKSNIKIAKELRVSEASVRRRIRVMEKIGLIRGYSVKIDFGMIEHPVKVYLMVRVGAGNRAKVVRKLIKHPRAVAVYSLARENELMAVMLFSNTKELREFESRHPKVEGARSVTMQVVMHPHKGVVWSGA